MRPLPGHNLKYFTPTVDENQQVVKMATASANYVGKKISFKVHIDEKDRLTACLTGLIMETWDTSQNTSWFTVTGNNNIEDSLARLLEQGFITKSFHDRVTSDFPQSHVSLAGSVFFKEGLQSTPEAGQSDDVPLPDNDITDVVTLH